MSQKGPQEVTKVDGESGWEDPDVPLDPDIDPSASEFAVSEEVHVKEGRKGTKDGRPKEWTPAIGVPTPKFRMWKSDSTNPNQRVKPFCNYWNGLPQWAKENTLLYVYREFPVLLYVDRTPDSENKDYKNQEFNYIDKISGAEPLQDETDLLHRYGCGNYKLVFNALVTGKPNRTLCTVYVTNLGGGDFKSNPPTDRRISDVKNVDLNYPSNASYVSFLRGQGLLPNQIDAIKEGQEMATLEVVKEQQKTTDRLLEAVLDGAKERGNRQPQDSGLMEKAVSGAMDVVKEGSKAAIQITREANEYANKVRGEVNSQQPTADPLETAIKLMGLIHGGAGKDDAEVIELRRQMDQIRNDQMTAMREELKIMREALMKPTNTGNPFDYMKGGMESLRGMMATVDEIRGGGESKSNVAEDIADAAGAPKWLTSAMPIIGQLGRAAEAYFSMRAQQNMPPGTYQPPPPPPTQYAPPTQQWAPSTAPTPGPQLVAARHPLGTLDPTQFDPELSQLLTSISIPLQGHLSSPDATGTDFADWFIGGFGESTYNQIVEFGVDNVVGALYSFQPTLQAIQQFPTEKVQGFVAEFLNPKFEDQEEGEEPESEKESEDTKQPA